METATLQERIEYTHVDQAFRDRMQRLASMRILSANPRYCFIREAEELMGTERDIFSNPGKKINLLTKYFPRFRPGGKQDLSKLSMDARNRNACIIFEGIFAEYSKRYAEFR